LRLRAYRDEFTIAILSDPRPSLHNLFSGPDGKVE